MGKSVFLQEKYVTIYKVIGVTAGVYLAFRYALPLFAPFVAAYLLAGAVRPAVSFMKRRLRIPVGVGATLMILLLVAALGAGVFFLGKLLIEQVVRLIENYGSYRETTLAVAERLCGRVDGWFSLTSGTAKGLMYTGLDRIGETVNREVLPKLSGQSLAALGWRYGMISLCLVRA